MIPQQFLITIILTLTAIANANFIAFTGNKCDGTGGAIVSFKGCTNLKNRHSFKFVDKLPFSPTTYISFWAKSKCTGNENGYKNPKLNQCYNIHTGGKVLTGHAYDNCHVSTHSFPIKSCPDVNDKHAVKRDNDAETSNDDVIITPVDDSDSNPVYIFDNYEYSFDETVARLEAANVFQVYKQPFNESSSDNEATSVPKWLFSQLIDLATA